MQPLWTTRGDLQRTGPKRANEKHVETANVHSSLTFWTNLDVLRKLNARTIEKLETFAV